ncbi:CPBP family intramembrane glutamic endopeptidase [Fructobacillus parabroussonetiae]|uniref:CPBP family intramembrane metalloprotease n=1 Tax=Fructobacillus parabroussonetiae TaxID=2713174 RepID=A0ABS5QW66_9LACO|nr:CPBP family intramembrane glutamic endopeptidase [Fructobacillus parabroussonetiae]MBS9337037.1 CPBP family intramembrane metalloprotease [Fructobacillus parabroussonetiae]
MVEKYTKQSTDQQKDWRQKTLGASRMTLSGLVRILSWLSFFCFEYLAMALMQGSILMTGRQRYLLLLCGLLLAYSFIRFGLQALQKAATKVRSFTGRFSIKKVNWPTLSELAYLASIYVISLAGMMIWGMFENFFLAKWAPSTTENQAAIDGLMNAGGLYSTIVLSLIIVFLGPVMEELLFRGLFFRYFKWVKAPMVTVFLSGLLFGLYHLGSYNWLSLLDLPPYLIIGTGFAYAYEKTDKLSSSIIMHIFHNGWVQAASLLMLFH